MEPFGHVCRGSCRFVETDSIVACALIPQFSRQVELFLPGWRFLAVSDAAGLVILLYVNFGTKAISVSSTRSCLLPVLRSFSVAHRAFFTTRYHNFKFSRGNSEGNPANSRFPLGTSWRLQIEPKITPFTVWRWKSDERNIVQEGLIRLPLQPSLSGQFGREPLLNGG